jgi:1,4-alpha-glucan branching enzyme
MRASQQHIDGHTPMGATRVPGGCTFRTWAPRAKSVYVGGSFNAWQHDDAALLSKDANGYWAGFIPDVVDGQEYKFYVVGKGSEGWKRDPYSRELSHQPEYPHSNCVIRNANGYPWHDGDFHPPAFSDLIIYQFHVGRFFATDAAGNDRRPGRVAKFLDVLDRVEYLAELGVTAIEPMPIVEFPHDTSLGYNGVDYFSPEMAYSVPLDELAPYVDTVNRLLTAKGKGGVPVTGADLWSQAHQLKALIDVCHVCGIAVILDVVYNHAGGEFGDEALYFFDRYKNGDNNNSLYFTADGWAGGLVFAYWNADVRQYLIDNAEFWLTEYHADGLRYDEVTVIDGHGGWNFCQNLTDTLRFVKPAAPNIAEYWKDDKTWALRPTNEGGAGFDMVWDDGLRGAVRGAIAAAAGGRDAYVNLDAVRDRLYPPLGFSPAWRAVTHLENHDLLLASHSDNDRRPRIAALADPSNSRSWFARSRARVANGLLLTAPGAPMLFMGQEFLEDKYWTDDFNDHDHLIWWDGLRDDEAMRNHLRFTRELIALRRREPALRGDGLNVFHVHSNNRVIAFHRWVEGQGRDVVIVASLNESTFWGYSLGFPESGWWREAFNSDVYDHWVNPQVAGNGDGVNAHDGALHGLPANASVVIPANGILVFVRG